MPYIEGDDLHPQSNIDKMAAGHPLTDADREPWLELLRNTAESIAAESFYAGPRSCRASVVLPADPPEPMPVFTPASAPASAPAHVQTATHMRQPSRALTAVSTYSEDGGVRLAGGRLGSDEADVVPYGYFREADDVRGSGGSHPPRYGSARDPER